MFASGIEGGGNRGDDGGGDGYSVYGSESGALGLLGLERVRGWAEGVESRGPWECYNIGSRLYQVCLVYPGYQGSTGCKGGRDSIRSR